jgi:hypothetical protein
MSPASNDWRTARFGCCLRFDLREWRSAALPGRHSARLRAVRFALRRAHSAPMLLAAFVIVTGFFSAFLKNDSSPYNIKLRQERHEEPTGSR